MTVVLTPFAAPLELLGVTEKVVVDVMLAVACAGLLADGVAGADQLKLVAAVPVQAAVKLTFPPPEARLLVLGVTEHPVGTPVGVGVWPASQFNVNVPLLPDTEKDEQLLLLNVIDAAFAGVAPKVTNELQQTAAATRKVRIIYEAPLRMSPAGGMANWATEWL